MITENTAGQARETGPATRLLVEVSAPFRLDYVAWALRRRAHNEVDRFDHGWYRRVLCLPGGPAEVSVRQDLTAGAPSLIAELRGPDGPIGGAAATEARPVLERMLGLRADLGGFYQVAARDCGVNALAARFRGMRPPCFPTVFEAVVNAVACQQLSLDVGIHLLNRLARRFGPAVPGPVTRYGFPEPGRLAAADLAELRSAGFSTAKARTIISVAGQVAAGALDLEALRDADDDRATGILLGLPGIGRWSAEYVMLRGLARYHVLPGDDVGARNNLRRRFGLAEDAGYDEVATLSRRWQPYAGLVYFHLLLDALAARGDLEEARLWQKPRRLAEFGSIGLLQPACVPGEADWRRGATDGLAGRWRGDETTTASWRITPGRCRASLARRRSRRVGGATHSAAMRPSMRPRTSRIIAPARLRAGKEDLEGCDLARSQTARARRTGCAHRIPARDHVLHLFTCEASCPRGDRRE